MRPEIAPIRDVSSNSDASSELSSIGDDSPVPYDKFDTTAPDGNTSVQVVIPQPKTLALPYSSNQSGLVYDVRMRFHTELIHYDKIGNDYHPEDPRRTHEIFTELSKAGLVVDELADPSPEDHYKLWRIRAREATPAEICLVHTSEHYGWAEGLPNMSNNELIEEERRHESIYLHKMTFFCAKLSCGGAIEACRAVVAGHVKNSIAVIRPPGHHAESDEASGFCFFDNVGVAARVCQRDFPDKCRKVFVLDWDVHHGNGVQEAFYKDPNVLYISLHVHCDGNFYPPGPFGDHKHCGEGEGLGYNVNIPWSSHGKTDADYLLAFQKVVMPIAREFDPDLVIIAAGFDAAEGDTLGQCHISPAGYAHMTHMLMSLAKGKVAVVLEGGYNLRSISKSALAVTRTLMGEPPDRILDIDPTDAAIDDIQSVIVQQSRFWKRLYQPGAGAILKERFDSLAHFEIVSGWKKDKMWDEFKMRPLPIIRDGLSRSYEGQVLVTPNYDEKVPVLLIFHDPPEMISAGPNMRTGKVELDNAWLADDSKTYVEWAVKQGFGVIDVNIPTVSGVYEDQWEDRATADHNTRVANTREIATYLWDNYIYTSLATHLFVVGIGDAYSGLVHLLNDNNHFIDFIFGFVAGNVIQSVKRPDPDDLLPEWYFRVS
ncbi:hypothetical protein NA57DRAFT_49412, partial [Rhizodiscina lignyota]